MSRPVEFGEVPKIVAFPGVALPNQGPSEPLITMLEQLLDLARAGQLRVLVGTGFLDDGARITAWGGVHSNVYEMMGAINWTAIEYADRVKAQNPEPQRPVL